MTIPAPRPIGLIHTSFQRSAGTPIQTSLAGAVQGRVELFPEFEAGLQDLGGFDRIWLIYFFDRAADPRLVVKPYLDGSDRGVFATRAPSRPNAIGMSPVRLLSVEGRTLLVSGIDILDGTPLLDIKPYVPAFDSLPAERVGWCESLAPGGAGIADARFEEPPANLPNEAPL